MFLIKEGYKRQIEQTSSGQNKVTFFKPQVGNANSDLTTGRFTVITPNN